MDSSEFKRIRSNEWHSSAVGVRSVEDAEDCSCASQGLSCSTTECINRGLSVECNPKLCQCGTACQNQRMQRGKLPRIKCAACWCMHMLQRFHCIRSSLHVICTMKTKYLLVLQAADLSSSICCTAHLACRIQQFEGNKDRGMVAAEAISAGALVAEYIGALLGNASLEGPLCHRHKGADFCTCRAAACASLIMMMQCVGQAQKALM